MNCLEPEFRVLRVVESDLSMKKKDGPGQSGAMRNLDRADLVRQCSGPKVASPAPPESANKGSEWMLLMECNERTEQSQWKSSWSGVGWLHVIFHLLTDLG